MEAKFQEHLPARRMTLTKQSLAWTCDHSPKRNISLCQPFGSQGWPTELHYTTETSKKLTTCQWEDNSDLYYFTGKVVHHVFNCDLLLP